MATDWAALRVEYVNGSMDYHELAKAHGLKHATVRQRANREKWQEARHTLSQAVTHAAQAKLTEDRTDELTKFNEDDLKMARAIRAKAARLMGNDLSAQELRALAGAVDVAQKVGRLALGASTENSAISTNDVQITVRRAGSEL